MCFIIEIVCRQMTFTSSIDSVQQYSLENMPLSSKFSNQAQTDSCISATCNQKSDLQCRHCSEPFCQTCFIHHRRNLLVEMEAISEQMLINRRQGVAEVVQFINKQAVDANQQAQQLLNDTIDRIIRASENIHRYIENRRQAKVMNKIDRFVLNYFSFKSDIELKNLSANTIKTKNSY